jgi:hypothetical protein
MGNEIHRIIVGKGIGDAGKLTGMLLELPWEECKRLMSAGADVVLMVHVHEALMVLALAGEAAARVAVDVPVVMDAQAAAALECAVAAARVAAGVPAEMDTHVAAAFECAAEMPGVLVVALAAIDEHCYFAFDAEETAAGMSAAFAVVQGEYEAMEAVVPGCHVAEASGAVPQLEASADGATSLGVNAAIERCQDAVVELRAVPDDSHVLLWAAAAVCNHVLLWAAAAVCIAAEQGMLRAQELVDGPVECPAVAAEELLVLDTSAMRRREACRKSGEAAGAAGIVASEVAARSTAEPVAAGAADMAADDGRRAAQEANERRKRQVQRRRQREARELRRSAAEAEAAAARHRAAAVETVEWAAKKAAIKARAGDAVRAAEAAQAALAAKAARVMRAACAEMGVAESVARVDESGVRVERGGRRREADAAESVRRGAGEASCADVEARAAAATRAEVAARVAHATVPCVGVASSAGDVACAEAVRAEVAARKAHAGEAAAEAEVAGEFDTEKAAADMVVLQAELCAEAMLQAGHGEILMSTAMLEQMAAVLFAEMANAATEMAALQADACECAGEASGADVGARAAAAVSMCAEMRTDGEVRAGEQRQAVAVLRAGEAAAEAGPARADPGVRVRAAGNLCAALHADAATRAAVPKAVASAGARTQVTAPAGLVLAAVRVQDGQCLVGQCMVASGIVEACELCGESELGARCYAGEMRDRHVTGAAELLLQAAAWQEEDRRSACETHSQEVRACLPERMAGVSTQAAQLMAARAVELARMAMDTRAAAELRRESEAASRVLATCLEKAALVHESCYRRGWRRRGRVGR